jgi:adenylylsulfate kinase
MAGLLEKHGTLVIATFVSPYRESRAWVRRHCRRFIEVHVATPLAECERRDVKGLYVRARKGDIANFTGISDPYEPPRKPALTIDTTGMTIQGAAARVCACLERRGIIPRVKGSRR